MEEQGKYNSKGGRPIKPKEFSQNYHTINLSFTKAQWEQFNKEQANYKGTRLGYARMKVLNQDKHIAHSEKNYRGFQKELNKVGVNLNQIAKHLNSEGFDFVDNDTKIVFNKMIDLLIQFEMKL